MGLVLGGVIQHAAISQGYEQYGGSRGQAGVQKLECGQDVLLEHVHLIIHHHYTIHQHLEQGEQQQQKQQNTVVMESSPGWPEHTSLPIIAKITCPQQQQQQTTSTRTQIYTRARRHYTHMDDGRPVRKYYGRCDTLLRTKHMSCTESGEKRTSAG
jgi:hypothetical protein